MSDSRLSPSFDSSSFDFPSSRLEAFGFDDEFAQHYVALRDAGGGMDGAPMAWPVRVLSRSLDLFRVLGPDGERPAEPSGRLRSMGELPVVGDWALAVGGTDGPLLLTAVLPRRTVLSRKVPGDRTAEQVVAANVDTVFIVMGLDGDFSLRRLERFSVMIWESGAQPVAVLTKTDLHDDPTGARLDAQGVVPGVPVLAVSAITGTGLEPLQALLEPRRTVALVGSSGAGKSTLLNYLCGAEIMRTGAVREGDDRGRHTTTHRQLVALPGGGLLIDNPGVREIQLWAQEDALGETFGDIDALAENCRFRDCHHYGEPGCAVEAALADGTLEPGRLESWRKLEKELLHLERRQDVAASRQADRKLGLFYKSVIAAKKKKRQR